MVSVAASGSTSWVSDPSLESYALEQPEMLKSNDYKHSNVMHSFSGCPQYFATFARAYLKVLYPVKIII